MSPTMFTSPSTTPWRPDRRTPSTSSPVAVEERGYPARVVLERLPGLTYRKLDYWCRTGALGDAERLMGRGNGYRRWFFEEDIRVMKVLNEVSMFFTLLRQDSGGASSALLGRVARHVRAGSPRIYVGCYGGELQVHGHDDGPPQGVYLSIDIEAVLDGCD